MNRSSLSLILLLLVLGSTVSSAAYREFTNRAGKSLVAKILSKTDSTVTLERKDNGKKVTVKITAFRWEDQEYIRGWAYGQDTATSRKKRTGDMPEEAEHEDLVERNRLYPRTKKEIKEGLTEIRRRKRPEDVSKAEFESVKSLNMYRFLSGVPSDVKSDPQLNKNADLAAKACEKAGRISHSLGSFTDKCNLAGGGGMVASVRMYMDDRGANNRAARGHRRWCLNPPMAKTGFGGESGMSAMWAMDHSRKSKMDFWAYPGEGFYPEEYLHGNSWSAYFNERVPAADDLKIRVFKLRARPEKKPIKLDEIAGRELPILYKASSGNSINFEVEYRNGRKKGIYWVSIKGGGLSHGYLVELY